jgi:peptidoglycan/xylan/chitin deacetylase (PgdA/CDA1 family)
MVDALEALYEQVARGASEAHPTAAAPAARAPWGASTVLAVARALDASPRQALRVLVYHRVCDPAEATGTPHVLSATPEAFEIQMRYLARHYAPVTADDVAAALRERRPLPPRAVLLTFDDGYWDVLTTAWPILRRHALPALLFVATAYPGAARCFWWDELFLWCRSATADAIQVPGLGHLPLRTDAERRAAYRHLHTLMRFLPPLELSARLLEVRQWLGAPEVATRSVLTWDEIRTLAAEGLAVGSHTRHHAALPHLTDAQLAEELHGAHRDLEREVDRPAPLFAYPFGRVDARAVPVLRALGYSAAFMALPGRNLIGHRDPYQLFRHSLHLDQPFVRFAMSLTMPYVAAREQGRALKAHLRQGGHWGRAAQRAI